MQVTQLTTRTAASTYTTPPDGEASITEANGNGLNANGSRMGFDVATQTYTLGLQLDWCVAMVTEGFAAPLYRAALLKLIYA